MATIDAQHRQRVDYLNQRYDAMQAGKGKDALEKIFRGLGAYMQSHFATEESLMKLYRFPDYEGHKAIHAKMAAHVDKLEKDFVAGKIHRPLQIVNFRKDWLAKHIMDTDQKYAPFLKAKGLV